MFSKKLCRAQQPNSVISTAGLLEVPRACLTVRNTTTKTRIVITTQTNLDQLADRVHQAYLRRHPKWLATGLTPGVWTAAAVRLHEIATNQASLPIDPELFVAVQNYKSFRRDPWRELTQEGASKTYLKAVRQIVRQLKIELNTELRWAHRYLATTGSFDQLLKDSKAKVSPIIKLFLCHQLNEHDREPSVRAAAEAQHLACPLYRLASKHLLPNPCYPQPVRPFVLPQLLNDQKDSYTWN